MAFSPDNRRVVSGSGDKTLKLWETESGALIRTFEGHTDTVRSGAFSPDGRRVVSGSYDKTLKLWDVESGICTTTMLALPEDQYVSVFPGGRFTASPGSEKFLAIVDGFETRPIDEAYRQAFQNR